MVIIINVDASANNIGQIELPFTPTADTEAYLAAIPTAAAALTTSKKRAIDDFFITINEQGLKSKISHCCIPLFGRVEGGVNLVNPATNFNWPSDTAIATFDANGIKFSVGWSSGLTINRQDMHLGFFNTTSSNYAGGANQSSMGPVSWFFGRVANGGNPAMTINVTKRPTVPNRTLGIGTMLGSVDMSLNSAYINVDGEASPNVAITSADIPSSTQMALLFGNSVAGESSVRAVYSHGFFTKGTHLSPEDLAFYNAAITNLMTRLISL